MPPGARQELRSSPGAPKRAHSTRTETRAVGCGRLSQGQTMRAESRHVPHMSPFTVELILTAVHYCLLIGRPRAPSSPTAREMPRGVAVASSPGSQAQPTTLRDRRPIVMSLSRTGAPLEVMSTHRFQSIVNCKGGKGPSTPAATLARQHTTAPHETPLQDQPPSPSIVEHDLEHCPSPPATTPS